MVILEPKKIALLIAVLACFLTPFDLSKVSITLPTLASEFSMDAVTLGWVATAYLLASTVFLVPFGRMADIHVREIIFSAGQDRISRNGDDSLCVISSLGDLC